MSLALSLLDTPKKHSLGSQSRSLRALLKDFERTFTADHSRKPTRDDIKANEEVAAQYKAYNRIRDVLSGKLSYEDFVRPVKTPTKRAQHKRVDSSSSWALPKAKSQQTPQKQSLLHDIDSYDAPNSASPRPLLLTAIAPTPQRDGQVLGLFDMMSASARSSHTPSSTGKKRKLDVILEEELPKINVEDVTQTPQRQRTHVEQDVLQHLSGTPCTTPQISRHNHSRTPISEGKKFMLSQFFATPSTVRYEDAVVLKQDKIQTPPRDRVLGHTPINTRLSAVSLEATPAYLKRSTSFKDRLMSATSGSQNKGNLQSPACLDGGPPTLRHFQAALKPLSQIVHDSRDIEEGDHDDDLNALRELEFAENNVLINEGQHANADKLNAVDGNGGTSQIWKKRGQKRSTKRTKIRPVTAKIADAPKFVSTEDHDEDDVSEDDEDERNGSDANPRASTQSRSKPVTSKTDPWTNEDFSDSSLSNWDEIALDQPSHTKRRFNNKVDKGNGAGLEKENDKTKSKVSKKAGKINPNALSHMNFRTLKIRNKNSKAKGGRRFGRR